MNLPWVYTCSHPETPFHLPPHNIPLGHLFISLKHPVSCIEPGLAIHFTYDIIHVSMPFSQVILPLPSPTESKRLFYTSVSLLLSRIQGYHLSKSHIYALVYCIGGEGNGTPLQHSCLENPWMEEPGGLQFMWSQRVRHNWATNTFTFVPILGIAIKNVYGRTWE